MQPGGGRTGFTPSATLKKIQAGCRRGGQDGSGACACAAGFESQSRGADAGVHTRGVQPAGKGGGAMAELTYGKLDKVLRSLGFSVRVAVIETKSQQPELSEKKARVYEHKATGAMIALPV